MPRIMRPSESWSIVAAVIAVIAGERPGIWKIPEPRRIFDRLPGEPAEHRGGVRAVGLGGPHRVVAEPLGLLDDLQLVLGGQAETPVADVDAELHASFLSAAGDSLPAERRGLVLAAHPGDEPERLERGTAYAKPPPAQAARSSACAPRSTACRSPRARRCSTGVRASERIIVGAYIDGRGGVCPMLAAHRARRRAPTSSPSPGRGTVSPAPRGASRAATEREVGILVTQLEASLAEADGLELDRAIAEHQAARRATAPRSASRATAPRAARPRAGPARRRRRRYARAPSGPRAERALALQRLAGRGRT